MQRFWIPNKFPSPQYDGVYDNPCPFGVRVESSGASENNSLEQDQVAGVGSTTCLNCHWCIAYTSTDVVCDHPVDFPHNE